MKNARTIFVAAIILACLINVGSSEETTSKSIDSQLQALELQRAQLSQSLGQKHPKVVQIDHQIQILKKQRTTATDRTKKSANQSDKDLRQLVAHLLQRVEKLEQEVDQLKKRKPKVELLSN